MQFILRVPPEDRDWIRLAHYEGLDFGPTSRAQDDDAPLSQQSVSRLHRRLQASQRLNAFLHAERERNEALLAEVRAVAESAGDVEDEEGEKSVPTPSSLAFLRDSGDLSSADAERPLATTAAFTLSQLQAVRALTTSLRNITADLTDGGLGSEAGEDTDGSSTGRRRGWRRDRLGYVEGAGRKHLENVRGLELGDNGDVRDGEWQGQGRRLAQGEVEGLEKVVSILGGGPEAAATDTAATNAAGADEMDES